MSVQKKVINVQNRAISILWNVAAVVEYAAGHKRLLKRAFTATIISQYFVK